MTEVVRDVTVTRLSRDAIKVVWSGLDGDDSGKAVDLEGYPDKTVQVIGTNNGETMTFYGSNDPAVNTDRVAGTIFSSATAKWGILTDALGNSIAIATSNVPKQVLANPRSYCPVVTGGGGSTNISVIMIASRTRI